MAVVTVEAPFRDFVAFWERARGRPPGEQRDLWRRLYAARHASLMEYYERNFGAAGSVADALGRYGDVAGELEARFAALELERAGREVAELVGVAGSARAVAMVGTFTADAWMDEFERRPTVFFALEQIAAGGRARALAVHELAHAAHHRARSDDWPDDVPGLDLLREGFAIAVSVRVAPRVALEHHFAVADYAAWRRVCDEAWGDVAAGLLEGLEAHDPDDTRRFFWPDWGRAQRDVPERCGYLVGARVVEALLDGHDLADVARWPAERALDEVRGALEALR